MRTARLLSFLPGIRKLVRDNRRLRAELERLKSGVGDGRGILRATASKMFGAVASAARGDSSHTGGAVGEFCPKEASYILAPKLGAAYVQIPKSACSSIMARILAVERPETYAGLPAQIERIPFVLHHADGIFDRSQSAHDLLRFTFVRHPFDRVLSYYINQINPPVDASAALIEEVERAGFRIRMPFDDYVARIREDQVVRNNHHVRPQAEFLVGARGLTVDFIGKVEEMESHWARLDAALGGNLGPIARLNYTGGNSWRGSALFDQRVVEALAEHYRYDLWLLDYGIDRA